jgi:tripartite-type tricarboxylate transporter receptor subunit TctC
MALAILFAAAAVGAGAQEFPDKPMAACRRVPADIAGRIVTEQLSVQLPQRMIVDNRPGDRRHHWYRARGQRRSRWLHDVVRSGR